MGTFSGTVHTIGRAVINRGLFLQRIKVEYQLDREAKSANSSLLIGAQCAQLRFYRTLVFLQNKPSTRFEPQGETNSHTTNLWAISVNQVGQQQSQASMSFNYICKNSLLLIQQKKQFESQEGRNQFKEKFQYTQKHTPVHILIQYLPNHYKFVSVCFVKMLLCLKKQYNSNVGQQAKYNFLNGLLELIISHPTYETIVINFIEMTDIKLSENKFIYIVLKILEYVKMNSNKKIQIALDTVFKISEAQIDLPSQFQVVRLIAWRCDIKIIQSDFPQTSLIYQFIKDNLLNERKYKQITKEQCEFIKRGILQIKKFKEKRQVSQDFQL
ncbi:hypothetical protein pb186bvf_000807 [Paramecium bursaria]